MAFNQSFMLAVIELSGHQYIVSEKTHFRVESHFEGEVNCDKVLLVTDDNGKNFHLGTPYIEGAQVKCRVVDFGRGNKVIVYKMKPKKRYARTQGHRQDYTELEVLSIEVKKVESRKEKGEGDLLKVEEKVAKKPKSKAPAVKRAVAKKPAVAKKSVVKKPVVKKSG